MNINMNVMHIVMIMQTIGFIIMHVIVHNHNMHRIHINVQNNMHIVVIRCTIVCIKLGIILRIMICVSSY